MNYILPLLLFGVASTALNRAGRGWISAAIGGFIVTVSALIFGMFLAVSMGFEHPNLLLVMALAVFSIWGIAKRQGM